METGHWSGETVHWSCKTGHQIDWSAWSRSGHDKMTRLVTKASRLKDKNNFLPFAKRRYLIFWIFVEEFISQINCDHIGRAFFQMIIKTKFKNILNFTKS
jgi:hypothetical protein